MTTEELEQAVTDALMKAKESGEFDGAPGKDGKDGISVTHSWNGTTLTMTSASGTSSADLKGEKGDPGADGKDGAQGPTGPAGADGKDYTLTEADKQEIAGMVDVSVKVDDTLTKSEKAADAKVVGDKLSELNQANDAQNTEIAKKANDADLAKVAKSGSYNDLTGKPTIPTVPSSLPNPNALTFTGAVSETYDGSAPKSVAIPTVPSSIKNPYKLKLSGAVTAEYDGSSEVRVEIPAGGGSAYELPIASATQLGGVQPVAKTDEMTQAVGVDAEGLLFTAPGSGGNSSKWELINEVVTTEEVRTVEFTTDANGNSFELSECYVFVSAFRVADGETEMPLSVGVVVSRYNKYKYIIRPQDLKSTVDKTYPLTFAVYIKEIAPGKCATLSFQRAEDGWNNNQMVTNPSGYWGRGTRDSTSFEPDTNNITRLLAWVDRSTNGNIGIGSRFALYGVRK